VFCFYTIAGRRYVADMLNGTKRKFAVARVKSRAGMCGSSSSISSDLACRNMVEVQWDVCRRVECQRKSDVVNVGQYTVVPSYRLDLLQVEHP
jgi:hypothetical protein